MSIATIAGTVLIPLNVHINVWLHYISRSHCMRYMKPTVSVLTKWMSRVNFPKQEESQPDYRVGAIETTRL